MAARTSQQILEAVIPYSGRRVSQELLEVVQRVSKERLVSQVLLEAAFPIPGPSRCRDTQEVIEAVVLPPEIKGARNTQEVSEVVVNPHIFGSRDTQEVVEAVVWAQHHATQILIEALLAGPPPLCSQVLIETVTRYQYDMDPITLTLSVDEHPRLNLQVEVYAVRHRKPKNIIE